MSKIRIIILVLAAVILCSSLASALSANDQLVDNKLRAEIDFLNNKLYKVNRYMDSLENKLVLAEKRKNNAKIAQINILLNKSYKRVLRIKDLILNKQQELAALYEQTETKPNYVSVYSDAQYNAAADEQAVQLAEESYEDSIQAYERDVLGAKPAKKEPVVNERPENQEDFFSGINTSFGVSADTQAPENGEVNAAQVAATFNASKGPVYFQYTHSRDYARTVDYYGDAMSEFDGMVNNRVEVGVSFTPGIAPTMPEYYNAASQTPEDENAVNGSAIGSGVSASSVPF